MYNIYIIFYYLVDDIDKFLLLVQNGFMIYDTKHINYLLSEELIIEYIEYTFKNRDVFLTCFIINYIWSDDNLSFAELRKKMPRLPFLFSIFDDDYRIIFIQCESDYIFINLFLAYYFSMMVNYLHPLKSITCKKVGNNIFGTFLINPDRYSELETFIYSGVPITSTSLMKFAENINKYKNLKVLKLKGINYSSLIIIIYRWMYILYKCTNYFINIKVFTKIGRIKFIRKCVKY